ncbi:MAG: AEC family transporter [Clostridia bacterium]|nr:AEC family transporter [Clostridia bacterium]
MFIATLIQVSTLLIYILVGYFLRRKNLINEKTGKVLSKLLTLLFTPAYTIINLSKNVSVEKISVYLSLLLAGLIILFVLIFINYFFSKLFSKDENIRNMILYMLVFSNMGYFGYPLIEMVFGAEYLVQFMIFGLPFSIAINTYGYYILTKPTKEELENQNGNSVERRSLIQSIISPPLIGVLLGLIFGFLPFEIPSIVYTILTPASNCMSASAMLLTGSILATLPFSELFKSKRAYLLTFIRLIIIPVIGGGILFLLGVSKEIFIASVSLLCLPSGMNVVVFPESVGKNSIEGAKACFVSYIIALATIPTIFYVMEYLATLL